MKYKRGNPILLIVIGVILLIVYAKDNKKKENTYKETSKYSSTATVVPTATPIPRESEEEYKESCSEYKWKTVMRNPNEYIGKRIVIDVKVSSVHKESIVNSVEYFFALSESEYGWFGDKYAIFNYTDKELKILNDDVIRVWGEIKEPQDTVSLIVNSEEVFGIDMRYVELLEE